MARGPGDDAGAGYRVRAARGSLGDERETVVGENVTSCCSADRLFADVLVRFIPHLTTRQRARSGFLKRCCKEHIFDSVHSNEARRRKHSQWFWICNL